MDEATAAARAVSHHFTFTSDFFFDTIGRASWHMDQPMGHPNSLGIWLLAERSRDFVTVLLSGEGADEVFGGYTRFFYASLQTRVAPWLPLLRMVPGVGDRIARQFRDSPADGFIMASLFHQPDELRRLRPESDLETVLERRRAIFDEGRLDASRQLPALRDADLPGRSAGSAGQDDDGAFGGEPGAVPRSTARRVHAIDSVAPAGRRIDLPEESADARHQGAAEAPGRKGTSAIDSSIASKSGFSLPLADLFSGPRAARLMEDQHSARHSRSRPGRCRRRTQPMEAAGRRRSGRRGIRLDQRRARTVGAAIPRCARAPARSRSHAGSGPIAGAGTPQRR